MCLVLESGLYLNRWPVKLGAVFCTGKKFILRRQLDNSCLFKNGWVSTWVAVWLYEVAVLSMLVG